MSELKPGDLVLPPHDCLPWRVLHIYDDGQAALEFVGDAWRRSKVVEVATLRPYIKPEPDPELPVRTPAEIIREFLR